MIISGKYPSQEYVQHSYYFRNLHKGIKIRGTTPYMHSIKQSFVSGSYYAYQIASLRRLRRVFKTLKTTKLVFLWLSIIILAHIRYFQGNYFLERNQHTISNVFRLLHAHAHNLAPGKNDLTAESLWIIVMDT